MSILEYGLRAFGVWATRRPADSAADSVLVPGITGKHPRSMVGDIKECNTHPTSAALAIYTVFVVGLNYKY